MSKSTRLLRRRTGVQLYANLPYPHANVTTFRPTTCALPSELHVEHVTLCSMLFFSPARIHYYSSRITLSGQRPHFAHFVPNLSFVCFSPLFAKKYHCPTTSLTLTVRSPLQSASDQPNLARPVKLTLPFTLSHTPFSLSVLVPGRNPLHLLQRSSLFVHVLRVVQP